MLVITHIAFRLKAIWAPAPFANVRLVGDLPIPNSRLLILIVPNEIEDEFPPAVVIVRLDNVLVDFWEQHARFETDAHKRLCTGLEDCIDGAIQCVEMIAVWFRQQIKIFLDEQTNHARPQCTNLSNAAVPHRLG